YQGGIDEGVGVVPHVNSGSIWFHSCSAYRHPIPKVKGCTHHPAYDSVQHARTIRRCQTDGRSGVANGGLRRGPGELLLVPRLEGAELAFVIVRAIDIHQSAPAALTFGVQLDRALQMRARRL